MALTVAQSARPSAVQSPIDNRNQQSKSAIVNPNRQWSIQIANRQSESAVVNPNRQSSIGNP
jgi:hypothetical protein